MFSQKWDIPHPYRVSLCDSFYSKLNEGSLMGGGAIWFHAPFLQFKENPPRDDPHSEGGGDWSSSAQAQLARRHRLRSWEGTGSWARAGPCDGTAKPGRMFSSPQHLIQGGTERGKSMFLTWFTVLEASFHMTWDMTSTWSSEAFGAPEDRAWQAMDGPEQ